MGCFEIMLPMSIRSVFTTIAKAIFPPHFPNFQYMIRTKYSSLISHFFPLRDQISQQRSYFNLLLISGPTVPRISNVTEFSSSFSLILYIYIISASHSRKQPANWERGEKTGSRNQEKIGKFYLNCIRRRIYYDLVLQNFSMKIIHSQEERGQTAKWERKKIPIREWKWQGREIVRKWKKLTARVGENPR